MSGSYLIFIKRSGTFDSSGIEGKQIVYTEVHYPTSVEDIRTNNFKPSRMKKKNGYDDNATPTTSSDGFMSIPEGAGEDIPF